MDRSHLLIMACLAAALSGAMLGCNQGPSGEYRTFTEAQLEKQQHAAASEESEIARADNEKAADAPETALESGDASDRLTTPIEPELVTEPDDATASPDVPAATETPAFSEGSAVDAPADENANNDQQVTTDAETDQRSPQVLARERAEFFRRTGALDPAAALASRDSFPRSPEDLAAEGLADPTTEPLEPREIKLLVPERTFQVEGPEQAIRVSYDDLDLLKVLNMEPVPEDAMSHFPDWLSRLNGAHLRIRGFMYPTFQATDLTGFVLARDNEICCFGRNPKIYDLIEVSLREGATTDYIQGRPFDVVGTLHIRPEWDPDEQKLVRLYQIDDAIVINR